MFFNRSYLRFFFLFLSLIVFAVTVLQIPCLAASKAAGSVKQIAPFKDVGPDNPVFVFIDYISQKGIINGFPDGTYHPQEGLTRGQAAAIICKAAGLSVRPTGTSRFTDVPDDYWAIEYITAAEQAGYLGGFPDGSYRPEASLTRAQGVSLVMRLCTQKEQAPIPVLNDLDASHWAAPCMATALALDMIGLSKDSKFVYPDAEMSRGSLARALAILLTKDPGLSQVKLQGTLSEISGQVTLERNGQTKVLKTESTVLEGDRIETAANSSVRISYPDGSSNLIEANSILVIKQSAGRRYIKKDGGEGIAVDYLNMGLEKGTLYGALATKHQVAGQSNQDTKNETETIETSMGNSQIAALNGFNYLAAASQAQPWYQTAGKKKVKVKVDMPWGIAAIRGTYVKITVNPDRTCRVSCLGGDAQLSGFTGDSVTLTGNDTAIVKSDGDSASKEGSMNAEDKKAFSEVKVQVFFIDASVDQDVNQEAVVAPSLAPEQTYQDAITAVQAIVDALSNSGIELESEAVEQLRQEIEEQLDQMDEETAAELREQLQDPENQSPSDTTTHSSSSGSGGTTSKVLSISDPTITLSKVYDGNTTAAVSAGTLTGVVPGDSLTVNASAHYNTADAGTSKTITVVYTINGTNAGSYVKPANFTVNTGAITAKQLTISAPTLDTSKTYDGTTTAAVTAGAFSGVIGGDVVAISAAANYNDANAGTNKPITVVYSLGGPDAGNYFAPVNYTEPNGTINRAVIDITTIAGLTAPVTGQTPDTAIDATTQYTGTVTWSPPDSPYQGNQVYTATISLNSLNYEATAMGPAYFTVTGASSTTFDNISTVTAVFPATAPGISTLVSGYSGLAGADFDSFGNLYVADSDANCVRMIDTLGNITVFAGDAGGTSGNTGDSGPATSATLFMPEDVAIDDNNNVYICDRGNARIRVVRTDGNIYHFAGDTGGIGGVPTEGELASGTSFMGPAAIAFNNDYSALYIADRQSSGVYKAYYDGSNWRMNRFKTGLSFPGGVAVDSSNNVYIGEGGAYRILELDSSAVLIQTIGSGSGFLDGPAASAKFSNGLKVNIDNGDRLFIADWGNNRVRMLSGGNIVTVAGNGTDAHSGDGGPALNASTGTPNDVVFDSTGNMLIPCGSCIRKVTPIP